MTAVQAIGRAAIMELVIGVLETTDQGIKALVIADRLIVVPPAGDLGNVVPAGRIADLALAGEATRAGRAEWAARGRAEDPE